MPRLLIFVLLALALAACGGQQAPNTAMDAAPAAASSTAASPEDTVNQAIVAMAQKDKATLIELFDSSVGNYADPFAFSAIQTWRSLQNKVDPLSTIALGPIKSQETKAPETSGQTTRIVVTVTYEIGKADWTFSLRQRDRAWKLLEINGKTTERKHP